MITALLLVGLGLAATDSPRKLIVANAEQCRDATRLAARDAEIGADAVACTPMGALLADLPPRMSGADTARTCAGTPVRADRVRRLVTDSLTKMRQDDYSAALRLLDEAEDALACLSEPVPQDVAVDLYVQLAIIKFQSDLPGSIAAFRQYLRYKPEAGWPSDWATSRGEAAFNRAVNDERGALKVVLNVVPSSLDLWVDGQRITEPARGVPVVPGAHLVQVRPEGQQDLQSIWVEIAGGKAPVLVLPDLVPADAVAWVADEQLRPQLTASLGAVLGEGQDVLVAHEGTIWQGTTSSNDWLKLSRPVVPSLARLGAGMAIGGGITSVLCVGTMTTLYALAYDAEDRDPYVSAFAVTEGILYGGIAIGGGGLLLNRRATKQWDPTIAVIPRSNGEVLVEVSGIW